ncbi:MAG: hypothetical protein LBF62_12365, partial [Tannerellaceae bacterium]|nr:hypothetical protein [Tannerellaceae bacterium]
MPIFTLDIFLSEKIDRFCLRTYSAGKVIAFTAGAMLAAIPGTLYTHYISYIDPTSFTVDESIFILSIVLSEACRTCGEALLRLHFL